MSDDSCNIITANTNPSIFSIFAGKCFIGNAVWKNNEYKYQTAFHSQILCATSILYQTNFIRLKIEFRVMQVMTFAKGLCNQYQVLYFHYTCSSLGPIGYIINCLHFHIVMVKLD